MAKNWGLTRIHGQYLGLPRDMQCQLGGHVVTSGHVNGHIIRDIGRTQTGHGALDIID